MSGEYIMLVESEWMGLGSAVQRRLVGGPAKRWTEAAMIGMMQQRMNG